MGAYDSEVARMRALARCCTAEDHGAQMAGHLELTRERNPFLEETFSVTSRDQEIKELDSRSPGVPPGQ